MPWWLIALIAYGAVNLIIAVIATIIFEGLGYFFYAPPNWGIAIIVFVILLIAGLPIAIFGAIVLLFEG